MSLKIVVRIYDNKSWAYSYRKIAILKILRAEWKKTSYSIIKISGTVLSTKIW